MNFCIWNLLSSQFEQLTGFLNNNTKVEEGGLIQFVFFHLIKPQH